MAGISKSSFCAARRNAACKYRASLKKVNEQLKDRLDRVEKIFNDFFKLLSPNNNFFPTNKRARESTSEFYFRLIRKIAFYEKNIPLMDLLIAEKITDKYLKLAKIK